MRPTDLTFTLRVSAIVILLMALLSSCATLKPDTYKTLNATKVTAEQIALAAIDLHLAGLLSPEQYGRIKTAYERARRANDTLIATLQLALDVGQDPRGSAAYNQALDTSARLSRELLLLAVELNIIPGGAR